MKAARRLEAKARREGTPAAAPGEDPDLAGIQPGPQPLAEWQEGLDEVAGESTESTESTES